MSGETKKGFDLAALMKNVSDMNTAREQIEYLPLDMIVPDPKNGYSMDGITELADNILAVGLQDPLRVYPAEGGRYMLSSGHRRRAALNQLVKDGSMAADAPTACIVDRTQKSAALREFELLMANRDNRKMTDADLSKQLERLEDVLRRLVDEEGWQFEGRRRDWVSKLSGESRSKIAKLHAIRANLVPELLALFDSGVLKGSAAYELQKLPTDVQVYLGKQKKIQRGGVIAYRALELVSHAGSYLHPSCKCPGGAACEHTLPRFYQTATSSWFTCPGGCCLKCRRSLNDCPYQCKRSNAKLSAETAESKASAARAQAEREKMREEARAKLTGQYMALDVLARDAGLKDEEQLPIPGCTTVGDLHRRARGEGIPDYVADRGKIWDRYSYTGYAENVADKLNVSVDFLLGRTDESAVNKGRRISTGAGALAMTGDTAPAWQTGEPPRRGRYLVLLRGNADPETEPPKEFRADLKADGWYLFDRPMIKGCIITAWYPLPAVRDDDEKAEEDA